MTTKIIPNSNYTVHILNWTGENNDKTYIRNNAALFYKILKESYQNIGGCDIYEDVDDMIAKAKRYIIVTYRDLNKDGVIAAVATFRYYLDNNSYKGILIGHNKNLPKNIYIPAVIWIVKHMIINWDNLYWIETSHKIQKWFDEFNGIAIPNTIVPEILLESRLSPEIEIDSNKGEYWYARKITGGSKNWKIMYGFNKKENIEKLLGKYGNLQYEQQLRNFYQNDIYDALHESKNSGIYVSLYKKTINALNFIEDVYYNNNAFKLITPNFYKILNNILNNGKRLLNKMQLSEEQEYELNMLCRVCQQIINKATVIKVHKAF